MLVETGYEPRALQQEIHDSLKRFNVLVCHRRFGKTVLCINALIDAALRSEKPRPQYAYIAPFYRQAKTVAWDYLKAYCDGIPGRTFNESELRVDFAGRRIRLFGGDNPDALRGIYLDGVVMDEYGEMDPRVWSEVIRPALSDRKGWGIFIGTPKGKNDFYELYAAAEKNDEWLAACYRQSETQILDAEEVESMRSMMSQDEYDQELECSFEAAIKGAYYGPQMRLATESGRITRVPYDGNAPVYTWWDLGMDDATAIWFAQFAGKEIHLVDYYEASGEALPHYVDVIKERCRMNDCSVGPLILPHDAEVRELSTGRTRNETLRSLGCDTKIAPRQHVIDGINAVRTMLSMCWFDEERCARGIEAMRQYRTDWDEKRKVHRLQPLHDWASHAADAFRYGAITERPNKRMGKLPQPKVAIV